MERRAFAPPSGLDLNGHLSSSDMVTSPISKKLNLGCGSRALPTWVNLDFAAQPGLVAEHDLRQSLPFAAATFDVVYHSHVLEHLSPADAHRFLAECQRVLRPGGILRIAVPDLEQKARLYLEKLAAAERATSEHTAAEHEWMVIELIDQMVRTRSGGAMGDFMVGGRADALASARIGDEFSLAKKAIAHTPDQSRVRPGIRARLARVLRRFAGVSEDEWQWLLFRRRGESHLWMYDRASLRSLLAECGFSDCSVVDAFNSRIPDWTADGRWLDVEQERARKPDSLFMEATKPSDTA